MKAWLYVTEFIVINIIHHQLNLAFVSSLFVGSEQLTPLSLFLLSQPIIPSTSALPIDPFNQQSQQ